MNGNIHAIGCAIEGYLMETLPREYLLSIFSEEMGIDDLVDQVLMEMIKHTYETTAEKKSIKGHLEKEIGYTDDIHARYSRRQIQHKKNKEKEIAIVKDSMGLPVNEKAYFKDMHKIGNRIAGYPLTPLQFLELRNSDEIKLFKQGLYPKLATSGRNNTEFREIAEEFDKMIMSYKEQSGYSDENMVLYSLAYFNYEWRYAFDFIYLCADYMEQNNRSDPEEVFSRIRDLLGWKATYPVGEGSVFSISRMVGFRERMLKNFIENPGYLQRYSQFLTLMTQVKENTEINGVSIKQWFVNNTDIHDWASFLREYDVFKNRVRKKEYSKNIIRHMRELIGLAFPNGEDEHRYLKSHIIQNDDILAKQIYEETIMLTGFNCYIEEYYNEAGRLCARVRDKDSNKRIVILYNNDIELKTHFLMFLSAAKNYTYLMPTVYDRNGTDAVLIHGLVVNEDADSVEIDIAAPGSGYIYK